jgi:hypothetical protein
MDFIHRSESTRSQRRVWPGAVDRHGTLNVDLNLIENGDFVNQEYYWSFDIGKWPGRFVHFAWMILIDDI